MARQVTPEFTLHRIPLLDAVQAAQQVGFKFVSKKAPLPVIMVDHTTYPELIASRRLTKPNSPYREQSPGLLSCLR